MIRWLHISDLHIQDRADWNSYKTELLKKCYDIGKIDLVIVTGDFHNYSDGEDFERARIFLRELMQKLELDIARDLFLIPGNHDCVTKISDKDLYIAAAQSRPLSMKKQWLTKLLNMFSSYELFVKKLIPNYPAEHPAEVHCRQWRNKINFIHCNTAIAADGYTKENQLLDVNGVASLAYSDSCPNIILAHNNFMDLHPDVQKRVKDVIRNNSVRAYLCGDRHMESVEQISYENNQNRQIPCIGCYKSAPDAADGYSRFGIIVGEWKKDTVNLKGWYWTSGDGFKIDGNITEQRIYMGIYENESEQKRETSSMPSKMDTIMPEKHFEIYRSVQHEAPQSNADCMMSIDGDMKVSFVAFSGDEKFIIAGSDDGTVKLWELSTGKHIQTFGESGEKNIEKTEDVVLLPNGNLGILHRVQGNYQNGFDKCRYSEWDIITGKCVKTSSIGGGYGEFVAPCLSDDGTRVVGWCTVLAQYTKFSNMIITPTDSTMRYMTFWYRSRWGYNPFAVVARNGNTGIVYSWNKKPINIICTKLNSPDFFSSNNYTEYEFVTHLERIEHVALSSDGELAIISGSLSGEPFISMNLLSIREKKYVSQINTTEKNCDSVFISFDKSLALYQNKDSFSIWRLPDGKRLRVFTHSGMKCINFSKSGKYAISGAKNNIKIWR